MKAVRQPDGTLVVTNVERFLIALIGLFAVAFVAVWFSNVSPGRAIGLDAVFVLFIAACLAGAERSTFVFDASSQSLRWSQTTVFRRSAGTVPLNAISSLSLERDFARANRRGSACRLVLHTASGPLPVTSAFTGVGSANQRVGEEIRVYLSEAGNGRKIPFTT